GDSDEVFVGAGEGSSEVATAVSAGPADIEAVCGVFCPPDSVDATDATTAGVLGSVFACVELAGRVITRVRANTNTNSRAKAAKPPPTISGTGGDAGFGLPRVLLFFSTGFCDFLSGRCSIHP